MSALVRSAWAEDETLLALTLDRPKGNVLTRAMMEELARALEAGAARPHLRLVTVRGAGGHFSFGASVEEHRAEHAAGLLATFHALARRIAASAVPVAALVEGQCLGAGFELALCCHFVFATPGATFACPEIKLGVFPPVLAAAGPARLGGPTAERLLLTGAPLDAEGARAAGFLTAVLDAADPEAALRAWYRQSLRPLSAFALRQATAAVRAPLRRALGDRLDALEQRYLAEVVPSHDGAEGIAAFLERRPARWEDR